MSATYSQISPSTLPEQLVRLDKVWSDARATGDLTLVEHTGTLDTIGKLSTAKLPDLEDVRKIQKVQVGWISTQSVPGTSSTGVYTGGHPTAIAGNPLSTAIQEYVIQSKVEASFSVPYDIIQNQMFSKDDLIERGYLLANNSIRRQLNAKALAFLLANAGKNLFQYGKAIGIDASIVPGAWLKTAVPYKNLYPQSMNNYLSSLRVINRVPNFDIISGFVLDLNERIDGNDPYSQFKFGNYNVSSDGETFSLQGIPDDMLLLSKGAVTMVSRYNSSTTPTMDPTKYNRICYSKSIPDLVIDGKPIMGDWCIETSGLPAVTGDHFNLDVTNRSDYYQTFHVEVFYEFLVNAYAGFGGVNGIFQLTADNRALINSPTQTAQQSIIS